MHRPSGRWGTALAAVIGAAACGPATSAPAPPGPADLAEQNAPSTVWDGVFTVEQARQGAADYAEACSSCHEANMRGNSNSPGLVGSSFLFIWQDRHLGELFTAIRTQMPTNAPNSLSAGTYAAVLAYILEANGFPPGARDLAPGPLLEGVLITANR